MNKIYWITDTHGNMKNIPKHTSYIHSGDIFNNFREYQHFYMNNISNQHVLFATGNHDLYDSPNLRQGSLNYQSGIKYPFAFYVLPTWHFNDLMKDYSVCEDYQSIGWLKRENQFASDCKKRIESLLVRADKDMKKNKKIKNIIFVTHFPVFPEDCFYEGKPTEPLVLPFMFDAQAGELISNFSQQHPTIKFTVLSGHTHHWSHRMVTDNLTTIVGDANVLYTLDLEKGTIERPMPFGHVEIYKL